MNATMRTVELRSIRLPDLPGEGRCDYPRDRLADEHVRELAELYREGGTGALPPIKLVEDIQAGELHLAGGAHRYHALKLLGVQWVAVEIHPTPAGVTAPVFARQLGIIDDSHAGKGFTPAERRYNVAWLLENMHGQDDADTAQQAGVTLATVRDVRAELTEAGHSAIELRAARLAAEAHAVELADIPLALHTLAWDADHERLRDNGGLVDAGRELAALVAGYGPAVTPDGERTKTYAAIRDVLSAAVEALESVQVPA